MKKLSLPQQLFLDRLASGTDGCRMAPFGSGGTTHSAWYRTCDSLARMGLVVRRGGCAYFPRNFAEMVLTEAEDALVEAERCLARRSNWWMVAEAKKELAQAQVDLAEAQARMKAVR